ncbi:MAG: GTPase Era [Burkholderiales bacterium]
MTAAFHAGTVAIVGRPNVGKSTLLNHLVGVKISIVSARAQTTRARITGILTRPEAQLVFVDTPGFQREHTGALHRLMNRSVRSTLEEVDVVLAVYEALRYGAADEAVTGLLPHDRPVLAVINKTDRAKDKRSLLPYLANLAQAFPFRELVPVSATRGTQIEDLVAATARLLPEQPALYGEDEVTLASERFLAAEMVREKLFRALGDELPYKLAVEIEAFKQEGRLRRINAAIVVDKDSQKPIVIGQGGERLKAIGTAARRDMEKLFGGKVHLELWVRTRSGWADDARALSRFGYE